MDQKREAAARPDWRTDRGLYDRLSFETFRNGTPENAVATVHAGLDAGVMLIDTALAFTRPGIEWSSATAQHQEGSTDRWLSGIEKECCGHT